MDSDPSKSDVESRLRDTAEAMSDRMSSIQEEVSSTGLSLRDWIAENPLMSVGGMLATGLAVGLLFGGGRRDRRRRHAELVDRYLAALREEVEEAVDRGEEPGPALEKALRDRVPLVVYTANGNRRRRGGGFLREAGEIIFSTGLSLFAREAIASMLDSLDVEAIVEDQLPDE
jgi:rhodanese-related sulfurtransferase